MGFKDTRGTLFFDICRIIKEKEPPVVVLENVKHLIYHDKKRTLKVILSSLEELGYATSYKLLNAKDFSIPQNRERLFIVGTKSKKFNYNALQKVEASPLKKFLEKDGDFKILDEEEYTLINNPKRQKSGLIFVGYRNKKIRKNGVRPNTNHLSRVHKMPNRIYSVEGNHPTIPSQEASGRYFVYDPAGGYVRKLTLNECYKLMGFPDDFKKNSTIGTAYIQIGNSVCVPVVKEIANAIKKQGLITYESQTKVRRNIQEVLCCG